MSATWKKYQQKKSKINIQSELKKAAIKIKKKKKGKKQKNPLCKPFKGRVGILQR